MQIYVIVFAALYAVWMVCSGFIEPFFLGLGAVSCIVCLGVARRMGVIPLGRMPFYTRLWMIPYTVRLGWEMLKATASVAQTVWRVDIQPLNPVLGWVPMQQPNDLGRATYANSITLTPGTVSVTVEPDWVQVHALDSEGLISLKEGAMEGRVRKIAG
ncbi:MAG: Na+/H+ antiporter subunit E [Hyphomicrobiales bacterium]|nr:Na+/H+ antiporter subunit E [Hyphomicrobiales bacterium]